MKKEALRVSGTIPAAPTTLYYAWLSTEQHSAMTGSAAKIDANVGGKYTACDGYISGKLVILDLGRRLVMSWRTTDFPREAPDSRVEIHLEAQGGSTRITVLHTEIPEGQGETYRATWNEKYFAPMLTFFTKYLPDPRKPPPPRQPIPPEDDEDDPPKKLTGKAAALAKIREARAAKAAKAAAPPPKKAAAAPASKKPVAAAPAAPPGSKKPAGAPPAKAPAPAAKKPAAAASTSKKPAPKAAAKKPAPAAKKPAAKPAAKKPAAKKPAPAAKKKKK